MTMTLDSAKPIGSGVIDVDTWSTRDASANFEFEYIDIASVDRDHKEIVSTSRTRAADAPSRARQIVRAGDVLVSTVRPNLNAVAVVPKKLDNAIASTGYTVLRCHPNKLDNRYLFHWVRSPAFVGDMVRQATGASYPAVSDRIIKASQIPLPPLSEQRRIADILDKADAIRRKRREIHQKTAILPRVIFQELFGDTSTNDRGWPAVRVDEAGEVQLGRQRSPKYQTGLHTHKYLRVANVFEDRLDLSDVLSMDFNEKDFERYRLVHGDILLNEGQSTELVGRPAMWRDEIENCCFQNTLVRFRAYREKVYPEYALGVFLDFLRRSAFARVSSKTSSVAHLGAARFAAMDFPLPPMELQKEYVVARKAIADALSSAEYASQASEDLFGSLVRRAFEGEL